MGIFSQAWQFVHGNMHFPHRYRRQRGHLGFQQGLDFWDPSRQTGMDRKDLAETPVGLVLRSES